MKVRKRHPHLKVVQHANLITISTNAHLSLFPFFSHPDDLDDLQIIRVLSPIDTKC